MVIERLRTKHCHISRCKPFPETKKWKNTNQCLTRGACSTTNSFKGGPTNRSPTNPFKEFVLGLSELLSIDYGVKAKPNSNDENDIGLDGRVEGHSKNSMASFKGLVGDG